MSFQLPAQGSESSRRSGGQSYTGRAGVALIAVGLLVTIAGIVAAVMAGDSDSKLAHYKYLPLGVGIVLFAIGVKKFSSTMFCVLGVLAFAYGVYLAFGSSTNSEYKYVPFVIGLAMVTYGLTARRTEKDQQKTIY